MKNENSILLCIMILIINSCNSVVENTTITERRARNEGIRTVGYPKRFANEKSFYIYQKGMKCVRKDDYECSKYYFEKALKVDPKNKIIINDLGLSETRLYNYDKAIQLLRAAISLDSSYYEAYGNLGFTFYYDGRYRDAINVLRLVDIDSTNRTEREAIYYHLFMNYTGLGNCDSAYYYYRKTKETTKKYLVLEDLEEFKTNEFDKNCLQ